MKILIVDDSIIFRKAVETALSDEAWVQVTGSVRNGEKALEFIEARPPDVVTLDMEMPGMNGIDTLKAIQAFNEKRPDAPPVRCIMLSSFAKAGADLNVTALAAGAFDVIEKPETASIEESIAILKSNLTAKLKAIPGKKAKLIREHAEPTKRITTISRPKGGIEAIAIGVSTGGPKALTEMLPALCNLTELPILIVQHMPPGFTQSLAKQLNQKCQSQVVEAEDGAVIQDGHVYIAPGGRHLTIKRIGTQIRVVLNDDPPENGCRPSVYVLFRSVAAAYGPAVVAAILTGMGNDGAKACKALKQEGARIIAQDEATSVVWGMPGSAVATGLVEKVEPLMEIPKAIKAMCES